MKKLLLLLAAGMISGSSFAQVANVHTRTLRGDGAITKETRHISTVANTKKTSVAAKTTSGATGEWFNFVEANNDGSVGVTFAYIPNYPDSNLIVVPTTGASFYWWNHGMGISFDPTSLLYSSLYVGTSAPAPTFQVTATNAYSIDSVEIVGFYDRVKNYTDTLFIEIASTDDTGAYALSIGDATLMGTYSEDTFLRWATPYYDYMSNSISASHTPTVKKITKVLDLAAFNDTTANGIHDWTFEIPGGLNVGAGKKVVVYTHFGSGFAYPFNTNIDSANCWRNLSSDFGVAPLQKTGDYTNGLVASSDERHHTSTGGTPNYWSYGGRPILAPSYLYTAPVTVHNPYISLHVKCPTCVNVGVNNTSENVTSVKAYPNPAADQVTIDFTMVKATDVTVSIYNIAGQVVATSSVKNAANGKVSFDTKNIPAGSYIYAVDADGSRNTGRINVAH